MAVNLHIPSSWNELNTWQVKRIAKLFHSSMSALYFDFLIFKTLLNARWWQLRRLRKIGLALKAVPLKEIKKHYSWIYESNDLTRFISKFKIDGQKYYSPHDRLSNINIEELSLADDLFLGWKNTSELEYLRYLTAVLYQPLDESGARIPFNKNLLDYRADLFSKLSKSELLAIQLAYHGSRNYMEPLFPYVFPKQNKATVETSQTQKVTSSGLGKAILELSGGKFGNLSETKQTNAYDFLAELNLLMKKSKKNA